MKATSLGYDLVRKTTTAPKEWWDAREKENSKIKKFRLRGIEIELEERYQEMFSGAILELDFAYTPSLGTLPPINDLNGLETLDDVSGNSSASANLLVIFNTRMIIKTKRERLVKIPCETMLGKKKVLENYLVKLIIFAIYLTVGVL
ncbi:hypothetical protein SLEP1_g58008 [Rubroshorea leprosula]|uniref:Uncharacterized protein n=1 Tax=Rubroshorea leprosula TaxID=152421 RepID=A0AAV5MN79_9ROSI|nr:hypothetical protein SLEP1_g58008 [Rubroshorea leprosula]